ncbi:hypothetical protein TrRE_jg2554 [Triparma retinervis]|uniref:Vesicle-fusing ATPase n=1 Tax=Triparma retinervis TaxID=2557542 RepID=A0A9W6ZUF6_9STRA|nr:hypothetical protein TrRE_jg2554 [Triparma retinervis]
MKELETHLDKYITRGAKASINGALKCLEDIKREEADLQLLSFGKKTDYHAQAVRACKRAGLDGDVLSGKRSQSLPSNYREDLTDKKDDFGKMRTKYAQPSIRQAPKKAGNGDGGGNDDGDDVATTREPSMLLQSSFTDSIPLGGIKPILQSLHRRLLIPLSTPPRLMRELGMSPCKGVLFYGPSGCGKTRLATYLASTLSPGREITVVNGPEIMKKFVGESEELDTEGMSGAEIEGICRSAASRALERVVLEYGDDENALLELCKAKESDFFEAVEEMKESMKND